jgi:hypothetical protein
MELEQKLDEIEDQKNLIILEIEQIENIMHIFKYANDDEIIKIGVAKTTLDNISYRLKKINKILKNIDEIIISK